MIARPSTSLAWALIVVGALIAATAHADEPPRATFLAPLPANVVEVGAGGGLRLDAGTAQPDLTLDLRWGISDEMQLAFPLVVTSSFAFDGLPLLSLRTGVTGFGVAFSNAEGVRLHNAYVVEGAAHFIGDGVAFTVGIGADAFIFGTATGGGVFVRCAATVDLTRDLQIGLTLIGRLAPNVEPGANLSLDIGTRGYGPDVAAPFVRYWALDVLSFEGWPSLGLSTVLLDDASVAPAIELGLNFSVTLTL